MFLVSNFRKENLSPSKENVTDSGIRIESDADVGVSVQVTGENVSSTNYIIKYSKYIHNVKTHQYLREDQVGTTQNEEKMSKLNLNVISPNFVNCQPLCS